MGEEVNSGWEMPITSYTIHEMDYNIFHVNVYKTDSGQYNVIKTC